ncbi:MAG: hypothetical protein JKY92_10245 [Magnetovibrio sp.]|nr:hypothetical protein [Magnetovibrio sp.]
MAVTLVIGGYATVAMAGGNMSHAHMEHVTKAWGDTPDKKGLLPTAIAEAKIAAQHTGFAAKKLDNLGWMQTHVRHVLNAIDPSLEAKGPGKGYGVLKAAAASIKHIGLAAKSGDASDNVRAHAIHVSASVENTVNRAKEIVALSKNVINATSAGDAAPLVKQIATLPGQLIAGFDANGDGTITWELGEGGLAAAQKHMKIMASGEDMN